MALLRRLAAAARRRRRALLASLVVLVLLAGLVADQVIRAQVRSTEAEVVESRSERDAARLELGAARAERLRNQTVLASITTQRNNLRHQAEVARRRLENVQGRTSSTVREIVLNAPQIAALTHCLNVVSSALNQAAVADPGAAGTLAAAEQACAGARAISRADRARDRARERRNGGGGERQ